MALGQTYGNQQKKVSPSTYSYYKMSNINSKIEPSTVTISYWNGMLKISIAPRKSTQDDTVAFDYDNAISIHLSVQKAIIFKNEIAKFMEDYRSGEGKYFNCGVATPKGCIYISNGNEFAPPANALFLTIKLLDGNDVKSTMIYEFNKNYHFSIRNYSESEKDYDRITEDYDYLEIDQLIDLLSSYIEAATCATAYTVVDSIHHITDRLTDNVVAIGEKLGVAMKAKPNPAGYTKPNLFDSSNNAVGNAQTPKINSYNSYADLSDLD